MNQSPQVSAPAETLPSRNAKTTSPVNSRSSFEANSAWNKVPKSTEPIQSRATKKIRDFDVLAVEEATNSKGNRIRRFLAQTSEKFSTIVLIQEMQKDRTNSDFTLLNEIAYAAGHILLKKKPNLTDDQFAEELRLNGYTQLKQLGETGIFRVFLPTAGLRSVEQALSATSSYGSEPDYLVFTSETLEAPAVFDDDNLIDEASGMTFAELRARNAAEMPRYSSAAIERQSQSTLSQFPNSARILTFDDEIITTARHRRPQAMFHNFIFRSTPADLNTAVGVGVSNGGSPNGFSYNGSNILWVLNFKTFIISHKDRIPFTIHQVDLSEYSTVFAYPNSFTFTGVKSDGSTVLQTFTTDGLIDGIGPKNDFQTFQFNSNFNNIVELKTSLGASYDNFVVTLEGQETPLRPNPDMPLYYSVDWNDDRVGESSSVGGRYNPSSLVFGEAIVRASSNQLKNQPVELDAGINPNNPRVFPYAQLQWELYNVAAERYLIQFECELSDSGRVFFDGLSGSSYPGFDLSIGHSSYEIEVDRSRGLLTIKRNNVTVQTWPFSKDSDITTIRFNVSDTNWDGGNFLDNFKIYAYGANKTPIQNKPIISLTPTQGIRFPTVALGGQDELPVNIRNGGSEDLVISGITSDRSDYRVGFVGSQTLIPGGVATLPVTFKPSATGEIAGNLTISSNDPDNSVISYPLSGSGKGVPKAHLTPASLVVSVLQGDNGKQTFTIGNSGNDVLNWKLINYGAIDRPLPNPVQSNDPSLPAQWAFEGSSLAGASVKLAWNYNTQLSNDVSVSVVDTGVDLDHPDLAPALMLNSGEIRDNGVDDDGNGYIDDVYGWNFYDDTNSPNDLNGHGTHVAGTIGAVQNNAVGVAGVSSVSRIIAVQFLGPTGAGYTSDAIQSIAYSAARGAKVLNASWGGGGYSTLLKDAITSYTTTGGGLFVAAAGNSAANSDVTPNYPSGYLIDGLLAVAATDQSGNLAYFSNFGKASVDIAAPGQGILSCYKDSKYASLSGTSMAAPHVSGAATLVFSQNPGFSVIEVHDTLKDNVDKPPGLNGLILTGGILNVHRCMSRVPESWIKSQWTKNSVPAFGSQQVEIEVKASSLDVGSYGSLLAFSTDDPQNQYLELPITIHVLSDTGKNQWKRDNFAVNNLLFESNNSLWSDHSDPDHDSYTNLLEYVLGGSPHIHDANLVRIDAADTSSPKYIFEARDDLTGTTYKVQWSSDLSVWRDSGLVLQKLSTDAVRGVSTWQATFFSDIPKAAFFRIEVRSN